MGGFWGGGSHGGRQLVKMSELSFSTARLPPNLKMFLNQLLHKHMLKHTIRQSMAFPQAAPSFILVILHCIP